MRLLRVDNDLSLQFEEFLGGDIPEYAILSHTWEKEEVSYKDFMKGRGPTKTYEKIRGCARQARKDGLSYIWVDTCCIDKRSSAELTEAINSMYAWYRKSRICYAYLADVPATTWQKSRWLTRGWTLQELIAPEDVVFYDSKWRCLGTKQLWAAEISVVTGIQQEVLEHNSDLHTIPAAIKMQWASRRRTTRPEDEAYCLLGLFDVNMPLLYGEGDKAFTRLQEAIVHHTSDSSLLAWGHCKDDKAVTSVPYAGALASSVRRFVSWEDFGRTERDEIDVLDLDKYEAHFKAYLFPFGQEKCVYVAHLGVRRTELEELIREGLNCFHTSRPAILILNISELNGEMSLPAKYVRITPREPQQPLIVKEAWTFGLRDLSTVSLLNPTQQSRLLIDSPPRDIIYLWRFHENGQSYRWDNAVPSLMIYDRGGYILADSKYLIGWGIAPVLLLVRLDAYGKPHIQLVKPQSSVDSIAFWIREELAQPKSTLRTTIAGFEGHTRMHRLEGFTATVRVVFIRGGIQIKVALTEIGD